MAKDNGFFEYIMYDVLFGIEGITSKRMFGGYGFYRGGLIFAIIADGKLYFKVGEGNRTDFEKKGSQPFVYPMKNGKTTTLSYWELPADIMENKEELENWISKAIMEHRTIKHLR